MLLEPSTPAIKMAWQLFNVFEWFTVNQDLSNPKSTNVVRTGNYIGNWSNISKATRPDLDPVTSVLMFVHDPSRPDYFDFDHTTTRPDNFFKAGLTAPSDRTIWNHMILDSRWNGFKIRDEPKVKGGLQCSYCFHYFHRKNCSRPIKSYIEALK